MRSLRTSASADGLRRLGVLTVMALLVGACDTGSGSTTSTSTSVAPATTSAPPPTTAVTSTTLSSRPLDVLHPDDLHVVFVWTYDEPVGLGDAEAIDPAVRLHAARDYQDLQAAIDAVPGTRVVLAPGALVLRDLEALAAGADDELLRLAATPVDALSDEERAAITDRFFDVPAAELDRYPRLTELWDQRRRGIPFDDEDLRDLQVLFGLAWLDLDHVDTPDVATVLARSRGFDDVDRAVVAAAHRDSARSALESWAALAESDHLEVAGITLGGAVMPLLIDNWVGAISDPTGVLPPNQYTEQTDALAVARRGLDPVEAFFGERPAGIVAGGGGLSSKTAEILEQAGVTWTVTGEDTLARSLGYESFRSESSLARRPDELYRPWRTAEGPVVFAADRVLSEAIADRYSSIDANAAAADFVRRLEAIAATVTRPAVVTVVVDGSDPWRHYDEGGATFLRALFERIDAAVGITTTTPSAYLDAFGSGPGALTDIWPGSLDGPNLGTWIGDEEEAAAWNLLWRVRLDLRLLSREGKVSDEQIFEAFDTMHVAEASGWLRWFGGDADTGDDRAMERHFRELLGRVYDRLIEPREDIVSIPLIGDRPSDRWSTDDGPLEVAWTGAGPQVTVELAPGTTGFDLYSSADVRGAEPVDARPASLTGTPLGFAARGVVRWSSTAPRTIEVLEVPPFGVTETTRVGTIPAVRTGTTVRFVLPTPEDIEPGAPLLFRIEPVPRGSADSRLLPADGPAEIMAGVVPVLEVADPTGDDAGPGRWLYPQDRRFTAGSFDLTGLRAGVAGDELVLQLGVVADIGNPFEAPSGVSLQVFDIAIDIDPAAGTGRRTFPEGRNVALPAEHGFEAVITVDRDGARLTSVAADGDLQASDVPVALRVEPRLGTITVRVPIAAIGGTDPDEWGFAVTVASSDPDEQTGIRRIAPKAGQWVGGGAAPDASHPTVYDVLWPEPFVQETLLNDYRPAESTGNLGPDDFGAVPLVRAG
jgi:alpha-amylase/alpha-mannosidase (GH57 family)